MTAQMREAFEQWFEADAMPAESDWFARDALDNDEYDHVQVQFAWKGWQAAIAQSEQERKQIEEELRKLRHDHAGCQGNLNGAHAWTKRVEAKLSESQKREAELQEYKRIHSFYEDRSRVGMGLEIIKLQERVQELETSVRKLETANEHFKRRDKDGRRLLRKRLSDAESELAKYKEAKPFGYWHVGSREDECDFFLAKDSGDVSCSDCIVLYAHPDNAKD